MPETDAIWMSLIVFIPSIFALGLLFFPRGWDEAMRWWSLFGTALTLGASLATFVYFQNDTTKDVLHSPQGRIQATLAYRALQTEKAADEHKEHIPSNDWVSRYPWIKNFNVEYFLGLDGISMSLVLLTTVLCFLAMIASWKIDKFVRGYCILFLVLETGMLGTFLALDFFLFYIFWEVMLLPMYFLIGIWGGENRAYAAIKFFLFTLLGSVFILIALLAFFFTDVRDFVSQKQVEARAEEKYREELDKLNLELKTAEQEMEKADQGKAADVGFQGAARQYRRKTQDLRTLRSEVFKSEAGVVVNTFDLMVLQRVGRAASTVIKDPSVVEDPKQRLPGLTSFAYADREEARRESDAVKAADALAEARKNKASPSALVKAEEAGEDAKNEARLAKDRVKALKESVPKRLGQWFFQPWFQYTMFLFLLVGFAIKVPVFPFHTWLPDAHVQAPTPISMILAGVLLKLGAYGIIRIAYPICPWAAEMLAWWVGLFGVINIVYGALAAMAQADFKKLVAYSSISHMGYVLLGIAVWSSSERSQYWSMGMNGAMFQMIAHGISSAGMFFLVGVIYDRAHHRRLDSFGGLHEPMPLYSGVSAVIFFAAMGLPGLCGFIGEAFVVLAAWNFSILFSVLSAATVVVTAAYILWTVQRVFLGTNAHYKNLPDIQWRELACIVPLVALSILLGVLPGLLLGWMEPSVTGLVDTLASGTR